LDEKEIRRVGIKRRNFKEEVRCDYCGKIVQNEEDGFFCGLDLNYIHSSCIHGHNKDFHGGFD
jgi:hypothetical protein